MKKIISYILLLLLAAGLVFLSLSRVGMEPPRPVVQEPAATPTPTPAPSSAVKPRKRETVIKHVKAFFFSPENFHHHYFQGVVKTEAWQPPTFRFWVCY